jgi:UDP-glucose 4-epimerase
MMFRAAELASLDCPILNGGSGAGVAVRDIVALLRTSLNKSTRVEFSGMPRRGDPVVLVADARRMNSAGIRCQVPLAAGVQRYADWFKGARDGDPRVN